jgi:hypothetical protein
MQNILMLLVFVFWGSGQFAQASSLEDSETEVLAESMITPFKRELRKVDPLSRQPVDAVLTGPAYKAKRGSDFDYYRYVTYYNVVSYRERFSEWPIQREHCGENSDLFAGWSKSIAYQHAVNASISVEGLGLGASFTKIATVTLSRNVKGYGKNVVDHVPYMIKENWEGFTYLQTSNLKTGKESLVLKKQDGTPYWFAILFPRLAPEYPMPFSAKDAEWTLDIQQRKISDCPPRK